MKRLSCTLIFIAFCKLSGISQSIFEYEGIPLKVSTKVALLTTGNDTIFGSLIDVDSFSITLLLQSNEVVEFQAGEVSKYFFYFKQPIKRLDVGDDFNQRIFVSPTAYSLKKGEREFRNIDVVYNSFHKGITDNLTIGGGVVPTLILNGAFLDAKSAISIHKNIRIGVGVAFVGGFGGDLGIKPETFGFVSGFGMLTLGTKNRFLNFMGGKIVGRGFSENEKGYTYSIGGSYKLRKSRFYAELTQYNLYQNNLSFFTGFNVKIKPLVFDFGIQVVGDIWGIIPFIGLSKRF